MEKEKSKPTEKKSIEYYKQVIVVQKEIINLLIDKIAREEALMIEDMPKYDIDDMINSGTAINLSTDNESGSVRVDI